MHLGITEFKCVNTAIKLTYKFPTRKRVLYKSGQHGNAFVLSDMWKQDFFRFVCFVRKQDFFTHPKQIFPNFTIFYGGEVWDIKYHEWVFFIFRYSYFGRPDCVSNVKPGTATKKRYVLLATQRIIIRLFFQNGSTNKIWFDFVHMCVCVCVRTW